MNTDLRSSGKRKRANSYIDNADKIGDNKIFDLLGYLNIIDRKEKFFNFEEFKELSKKHFFENNEVLKLQDDSYIQESEYQNIKIVPDCFDEDGNLVDIYPSFRRVDEIKINNLPKYYHDYIQILLNVLNIQKTVVYIYNYLIFDNTRDVRKAGITLNDSNYGVIIKNNGTDVYWILEHVDKIVINKDFGFNSNKIKNINKNFISLDIEKYTTPKTKKNKTEYLGKNWIAASKTRNAALNDHCLDYFRAYNVIDIDDIPEKQEFNFGPSSKYERINKKPETAVSFIDFLLTQGNIFEEDIIKKIKDKYKNHFVKICESYESRNIHFYKKTISEMKKGMPIIYQPVLYCYKHKTFGCADLIVRSDWLNKIVNTNILSEEEEKLPSVVLEKDYHYRVIDIKYSKLHFNTDERTLRNNVNVKPFKTQITLYNLALGEMQGYTPNQSYILGNGWVMNKIVNKRQITESNDDSFDKLGIIDYKIKDKQYIDMSLNAVEWLQELNNSTKFTHNPPNDPRLYPNMCNSNDGIYNKVKKQIANKFNEITLLPQCGVNNRNFAFERDIKSWNDDNCNSKNLNINGDKTKAVVDNIIKFNKQEEKLISINKITTNYKNWRSNKLTLYIDFETIGNLLLKANIKSNINIKDDFIFMIGMGWKISNNDNWNYECFYCKNISIDDESNMLDRFSLKIKELEKNYGDIENVLHWSSAEINHYNKINNRHDKILPVLKWFDLMKFFKDNCILILGAFNFSLKTIANKMKEYNMIETNWDDLDCQNGQDAMFKAWKMYVTNENFDFLDNIIKYNEIDCKTMFEIHNYLKLNH